MTDRISAKDEAASFITLSGGLNGGEVCTVHGHYDVICNDAAGAVLWTDIADNLVVTVGKNMILDQSLAGSAYTAVEYMGLISGASTPTIVAGDVMSSHAGWLECGNANAPTYTSPRKTTAWSAASSGAKTLSGALSFPITSTGTVAGLFIVGGSGAVSTIDNTSGVLIGAAAFSQGNRSVFSGDTIQSTYTITLT